LPSHPAVCRRNGRQNGRQRSSNGGSAATASCPDSRSRRRRPPRCSTIDVPAHGHGRPALLAPTGRRRFAHRGPAAIVPRRSRRSTPTSLDGSRCVQRRGLPYECEPCVHICHAVSPCAKNSLLASKPATFPVRGSSERLPAISTLAGTLAVLAIPDRGVSGSALPTDPPVGKMPRAAPVRPRAAQPDRTPRPRRAPQCCGDVLMMYSRRAHIALSMYSGPLDQRTTWLLPPAPCRNTPRQGETWSPPRVLNRLHRLARHVRPWAQRSAS
jgi:hypothetical protein